MPYTCKFIRPNLLEVHEQLLSFHKTEHRWWYYDTERWLRSCNGTKDEPAESHMSSADIEWCTRFYIPKAQAAQ